MSRTLPQILASHRSRVAMFIGILVLGILLSVISARLVPYNTDEFIAFRTIGCVLHPWYDRLEDSCHWFDLDFLGTGWILPLRVFSYAGSAPSLYYLPLYLLWPDPLSARFLGYLFLCLQALTLGKLFQIRFRYLFAGLLLFFPYAFQHFVDTGPVAFQITSLYLLLLLFRRWVEKPLLRYLIAGSFLLFFAVWTKLTFFWLLPGLCIVCLPELPLRRWFGTRATQRLWHAGFFLLLSAGLLSLLFFSTAPGNPQDFPLWNEIRNGEHRQWDELKKPLEIGVLRAFLHPLESTQRIFAVAPPTIWSFLYDILLYLALPFSPLFFLKKPIWKTLVRVLCFYAAFLVTACIIVWTKNSWSMHHAVLAFPFLIVAIADGAVHMRQSAVARRWAWGVGAVFVMFNVSLYTQFPQQPVQSHSDSSKLLLLELLHDNAVASRYVWFSSHWGFFFEPPLYGHPQRMYTAGDVNQENIDRAHAEGRKALFLYDSTQGDAYLYSEHPLLQRCAAIPVENVWQIALEPDSEPGNICMQ